MITMNTKEILIKKIQESRDYELVNSMLETFQKESKFAQIKNLMEGLKDTCYIRYNDKLNCIDFEDGEINIASDGITISTEENFYSFNANHLRLMARLIKALGDYEKKED